MDESKLAVSARHREEWRQVRAGIYEPVLESGDAERAKFCKAVVDILKILQEGERKAWGFGEGESDDVEISVDFAGGNQPGA